ncbi:helix-turn-helix domain-containing protein [Streptomyces cavernae]|uniref:helix-turn-helix domain-containing protein n=1 Tax=Streptomyces cavernae TaxID=2259034 RepID=UPI001391B058|nr:helix-turn-helix domain-containing protein [Streptomyces cavernae]
MSQTEATPRTLKLGAVSLAAIADRPHPDRRDQVPAAVPTSDPPLYRLALRLRAPQRDMRLYDSCRPVSGVVTTWGTAELIHVRFPKALLPLPQERIGQVVGKRLPGWTGVGALLADFVIRLHEEAEGYRPSDAARLGGVLLDLVSAVLTHELEAAGIASPAPHEPAPDSLMPRLRAFVERHLSDPGLSPDSVAAAHQISTRYLYKLFQDHGLTVAGWIRRRRLDHCRRDLADPLLRSRPVHAVAARWGFPDAAHFGRVFRAAYGVPPGQYRRMALSGGGAVRESSTAVRGRSTTS